MRCSLLSGYWIFVRTYSDKVLQIVGRTNILEGDLFSKARALSLGHQHSEITRLGGRQSDPSLSTVKRPPLLEQHSWYQSVCNV